MGLVARVVVFINLLHFCIFSGLQEVVLLWLWDSSISQNVFGALWMIASLGVSWLANPNLLRLILLVLSLNWVYRILLIL